MDQRLQTYNTKVLAFLKDQAKTEAGSQCQTIEPGTPEWASWDSYFRHHLGFEFPSMTRKLANQQQAVTVPTQWPEWFDTSYSPVAA